MAPKFGTSGLRGLVSELTTECIASYTRAFLTLCPASKELFVGRDLRSSSASIAHTVISTAQSLGLRVADCGELPAPALALSAMAASAPAIMVTGSHIPADRNGLKFFLPSGEITKLDEAHMTAQLAQLLPSLPLRQPAPCQAVDAQEPYIMRYVSAFGPQALAGLRIGIYQHSSVARDLLQEVIGALGGAPVPLARSRSFLALDTEAIGRDMRAKLKIWCTRHRLDAVVSTDGDADRPLLTDASGEMIAGDVLGILTAQMIGAEHICTPVTTTSAVTRIARFRQVWRTKIGSPHVIAAMDAVLNLEPSARVVGFEANGGFILGFDAAGPAGALPRLMTRDAFLPLLAPLVAAHAAGQTLAEAVCPFSASATASDRIENVASELGESLIAALSADSKAREAFIAPLGAERALDLTDGLRITLRDSTVIHLRPSGNAPEFRIYTEAGNAKIARALLDQLRLAVTEALRNN